jgi:hypothetical protein
MVVSVTTGDCVRDGVTEGVNVRVGVAVDVGRGVRVGIGVRVGTGVLVGVALGGETRVGVTSTSLG